MFCTASAGPVTPWSRSYGTPGRQVSWGAETFYLFIRGLYQILLWKRKLKKIIKQWLIFTIIKIIYSLRKFLIYWIMNSWVWGGRLQKFCMPAQERLWLAPCTTCMINFILNKREVSTIIGNDFEKILISLRTQYICKFLKWIKFFSYPRLLSRIINSSWFSSQNHDSGVLTVTSWDVFGRRLYTVHATRSTSMHSLMMRSQRNTSLKRIYLYTATWTHHQLHCKTPRS